MEYSFVIAVAETRPTLVARFKARPDELGQRFLEHLPKIADIVIDAQCGISGPPFARYHGIEDDVLDVEVGLMLDQPVPGRDAIVAETLPGGPVAKTVHVGSYMSLGEAHTALRTWVLDCGKTLAGPPWELYVSDPSEGDDPSQWRTEVCMPIRELS